jgi:hypothetical protein
MFEWLSNLCDCPLTRSYEINQFKRIGIQKNRMCHGVQLQPFESKGILCCAISLKIIEHQ